MSSAIDKRCKICQQPVSVRHTIDGINYYHCADCNFLQNFYWEERPTSSQVFAKMNLDKQQFHWAPSEEPYMREKGWEMLEFMVWPIAWKSRQLHGFLQKIPGYTQLVRFYIKGKLHRIMDFGCGHGTTILALRRQDGFDAVGLDPFSPTKSEFILREDINKIALPPASFDGIFAIETLEHITDVITTFKSLYNLLQPGGVLLIQTRRLEDPEYLQLKEKWFYLSDPQSHVSIYSQPALRRIAEKTGFKDVQFRARLARFVK